MAYVDLNPVRGGIADDLIDSDFTSIQQRIADFATSTQVKKIEKAAEKKIGHKTKQQQRLKRQLKLNELPEAPLMEFSGDSHIDIHSALPFTQEAYFELLDSTGRALREDKRGAIFADSSQLLHQLGIDPDNWLEHISHFGRRHGRCAGSPDNIEYFANRFDCEWGKGTGFSKKIYKNCA